MGENENVQVNEDSIESNSTTENSTIEVITKKEGGVLAEEVIDKSSQEKENLENENKVLEGKVDAISSHLHTILSELHILMDGQTHINDSVTEYKNFANEIKGVLERHCQEVSRFDCVIEKQDTIISILSNDIKSLHEQLEMTQTQNTELSNQNNELVQKLREVEDRENDMGKKLKRIIKILFEQDTKVDFSDVEYELKSLKEKYKKASKANVELRSCNEAHVSSIKQLENECLTLNEKKKNLEKQIETLLLELEDNRAKLDTSSSELTTKKEELIAKHHELVSLMESLKKQESEINKLEKAVETQVEELSKLGEQIKHGEDKIKTLTEDLKERENIIERQEISIAKLKISNSELEEKNAELNNFRDELTSAINPYYEIFMLMKKCESLNGLLEDFGLDDCEEFGIKEQIQFVNCFSDGNYCARQVYESMSDYKKEKVKIGDNCFLTESEKELISALNDHYRKTFSLDFDVLNDFGIKAGTKFDRNCMKDIRNAGNTNLRVVNGLCVPALLSWEQGKQIAQNAIIMGE